MAEMCIFGVFVLMCIVGMIYVTIEDERKYGRH